MVKLTFISSSPKIKLDVSTYVYHGEPIYPFFNSVPISIILKLPLEIRIITKFRKDIKKFCSRGGRLDSVQIESEPNFKNTRVTKKVLEVVVNKIKNFLPLTPILVNLSSDTWKTRSALSLLHSLGVVPTTSYLENDLLFPGWAGKKQSKRIPVPVLDFAPIYSGGIHIVMWGSLGKFYGSYDSPLPPRSTRSARSSGSTDSLEEPEMVSFISWFVSNLFKAIRFYKITRVWIDLRNEEGRLDMPLPALNVSIGDHLKDAILLPVGNKPKENPSIHDARKIKEEWEKQLFILDGLGF